MTARQQMVLVKLDNYMQNNETRCLSLILHSTQLQIGQGP